MPRKPLKPSPRLPWYKGQDMKILATVIGSLLVLFILTTVVCR